MKSVGVRFDNAVPGSPPARGAWIEMYYVPVAFIWHLSPPARGAWIEMFWTAFSFSSARVAPRKGGVD